MLYNALAAALHKTLNIKVYHLAIEQLFNKIQLHSTWNALFNITD